jgi:PKD repeat protein
MKTLRYAIFLICFSFISLPLHAQEPRPFNDSICVNEGDDLMFDITLNDMDPGMLIILQDPFGCFQMNGNFLTWAAPMGDCPCGEYRLMYFYEETPNNRAEITVVIKCGHPKPECYYNNLFDQPDPGSVGQAPCLYSCENAEATYYVPHISGNSYSWIINGHTSYTTNANGNEITILWGATGSGSINLTVTSGGVSTNYNYCVEILESPIADFTKSASCVCLEGTISFMNTSIGANSFLWKFGDGNTSTNPNPSHEYMSPGTYTVTLYAYKNNLDPEGNPLCCCADSMNMDIIVEEDPGPGIYWISTLCEGDKSFYWTDAMCGTYDWEVYDELGNPHPFTGDGTDTICVTWGNGPFGTISLQVASCSLSYCSKPSVAVVPIISDTSDIVGKKVVCVGAFETYTLPKWPSVYYDWTVTGGTLLPGQNGSNTVIIQWGGGPTGTIHVDYYSEFLGGLPIHEEEDCHGAADLTVSILPKFSVFGPNPGVACINSSSNFFATASPSNNYNWTVTPFAPFTGGLNNINVNWTTGPGTFVVTATPNVSGVYCNNSQSWVMNIIQVPPPDSIVGENEICPGGTNTYLGYSSTPNTSMEWTVQGGTPSTYTGSPISVTWNASGPYSISLAQMQVSAPMCLSDTITLKLYEKKINGPLSFPALPACINETIIYSALPAVQHPEAVHEWKIVPSTAGSVVANQGTNTPTIQWNNDAVPVRLTYCVTLCGKTDSVWQNFTLTAPQIPTIVQVGDLCPGQTAVLDAQSGFSSYAWSGPVVAATEDITISVGGTYVLKTIDANGCQAITTIEVIALPGPVASISTPDIRFLCKPANGQTVTLTAQTNPNYEFSWYCNGSLVQGPSAAATFTHTETSATNSFAYCVIVENLMTNCTTKSNIITVTQDTCITGPGGCTPESHNFTITPSNPTPNCNKVTINTSTTPNVIITGWNFGDPPNNTNSGTLTTAMHTYNKAGYYPIIATASVPDNQMNIPPTYCTITRKTDVCIPLAADFVCNDSCLQVCFDNQSTFLPANDITAYYWEFGDVSSSVAADPCHVYASPGMYDVTLTVTSITGCVATATKQVTVSGGPSPTITIAPNPACVGDPISFVGSGTGVISWLWDFDDGATNANQNPEHTYLMFGSYDVSLTVANADGCASTISSNINVFPNPMDDTISYAPDLIICAGDLLTLNAPPGAYTYLWSPNGEATSFINVGVAGDYSVKVTDVNGCMMTTDPVTVTVIPLPDIEISGPNFICDAGCVNLSVTAGAGYTYQWLDQSLIPLPGDTNQILQVCDNIALPASFYVLVTDANGCQSMAGPHMVDLAFSPLFTVSIVGDTCEGTDNILSVPILADVVYNWSTGFSGWSITAFQAGSYSVTGTDTTTGCHHTETVVINPLPDLCIVPTGCYEVCDPDTICGPDGLTSYQWNMNGVPIAGETGQCLIVTMNGSYSLTGTNQFGCSLTSDTLILNVIECADCTGQDVTSKLQSNDDCCYTLSYQNGLPNLFGIMMHTADADIIPDLSSLDPSLMVYTSGTNYIGLVSSTLGGNLPTGNLFDYLDFCLSNVTSVPQTVIFDWYSDSLNIVCSDTLIFNCYDDSDCVYIADDSIYCDGQEVFYEVTICNSASNTFAFNYLTIDPISPAGILVSPSFIDISGMPLLPGMCRTFSIQLSGSNIANKDFCFNLTAHIDNPAVNPGALCCSLDTIHCVQIPGCSGCDMEYVEAVIPVDDEGCCYEVVLNNYYDDMIFDGIGICVLSPQTTISINNPFGSDWITSSFTSTTIELTYDGATMHMPLGSFSLPDICIETQEAPNQLIEIKWMSGLNVVCRDTFEVTCEPPCGYIINDSVYCEGANFWYFEGYIKNTSSSTMGQAYIAFQNPSLSGYNQTISLGSLPPGGTFGPIFIPLGAPAMAGGTYCIDVTLHEVGDDNEHTDCCTFTHCFTLPDCGQGNPCLCDNKFKMDVEQGFFCSLSDNLVGMFSPLASFTNCDNIRWSWDDGSIDLIVPANTSVIHTFPAPGEYKVCMTVIRIDVNGKKCKARFCKDFEVMQLRPLVFPNPTRGSVTMQWNPVSLGMAQIKLMTPANSIVKSWTQELTDGDNMHHMQLDGVPPGLYFLISELNGQRWIEKLMVQ